MAHDASPFAPGVALWKNDTLYYQVTSLISPMYEFLVEGFDLALLIHLTVTNSRKPLLVN